MALASNVHCEVRVRDIPTGVELDVPVSDLNGITVPRRAPILAARCVREVQIAMTPQPLPGTAIQDFSLILKRDAVLCLAEGS
jgi:hypothetical protein